MFSLDLSTLISSAGYQLGVIIAGSLIAISFWLAFQLMRFISTYTRLRK